MEWRPEEIGSTIHNAVALIQVCSASTCVLFHMLDLVTMPQDLRLLLESSSILKVCHGFESSDRVRLVSQFGVNPVSFVDTALLAKLQGFVRCGLKALVNEHFYPLFLDKTLATSDWASEWLTPDQILYAATDAWITRELYIRLKAMETRNTAPVTYNDTVYFPAPILNDSTDPFESPKSDSSPERSTQTTLTERIPIPIPAPLPSPSISIIPSSPPKEGSSDVPHLITSRSTAPVDIPTSKSPKMKAKVGEGGESVSKRSVKTVIAEQRRTITPPSTVAVDSLKPQPASIPISPRRNSDNGMSDTSSSCSDGLQHSASDHSDDRSSVQTSDMTPPIRPSIALLPSPTAALTEAQYPRKTTKTSVYAALEKGALSRRAVRIAGLRNDPVTPTTITSIPPPITKKTPPICDDGSDSGEAALESLELLTPEDLMPSTPTGCMTPLSDLPAASARSGWGRPLLLLASLSVVYIATTTPPW
jgi:hypothetical protein